MKLDLPLSVPDGALAAVPDLARAAEETGFDGITYGETTSDPLLHLAVAAGVTSRVDLLTNIIVAFGRSPMTLAEQGSAVQDYSKGRLILGLGSQIKPHIERRFSMPWSAPAPRMVEYISAMRAIWHSWQTGDRLDFRGDFYTHTLMTPMFVPKVTYPAPKVFLAAVGTVMTEAAGAVADGLLVHGYTTERYLREVTLPALARGRQRAEGTADNVPLQATGGDGFEIVHSPFVVTGRTEEEFARCTMRVRERIAFYGSTPAYKPVLELHGWAELADELNRLSKIDDPGKWQQMGRLIDDDVLNAFAVVGEPGSIGRLLVDRFGKLITRCAVSSGGTDDPNFAIEVARSVREIQSR
ncbi:TIGR03617 family F420-dependent LLM class oxidoreductase [Jatrophihabitans sp. DSM 45814]